MSERKNENNYVCPYCGTLIAKDKVLFWETVKTQYKDNVRGEFLRRHGVRNISAGNMFPRLYYKVRPDENVTSVDENGFPTMIEDHQGNAIAPADLDKEAKSGGGGGFDDEFDSDEFDSGSESRSDRSDHTMKNIPNRACPKCHCELPRFFGTIQTRHVAMFGGRAAGKTAYIVNLFQQLASQLGENNLGSVTLEKESYGFLQPMIEEYERDGTTRPTAADGGLLPIMCHFKNKDNEAYITFYDIAGEGTADPQYMANHKGIANCETLLLVIDPNMFVGGAYASAWNANHLDGSERYGETGDCCRDPLDSFLNEAGTLCNEYSENIKYVVCVITKLDMMLEAAVKFFATGDIEVVKDLKGEHKEAVSLAVLKRVSDNLQLYLQKNHGINLKEKLVYTFGADKKINILGVSTSTLVKRAPGEIKFEPRSSAVDRKHRIIEPFLVVLMYFGLVPARNFKDEIVTYTEKEEAPAENEQKPAEKPKEEKKRGGLFGWGKRK